MAVDPDLRENGRASASEELRMDMELPGEVWEAICLVHPGSRDVVGALLRLTFCAGYLHGRRERAVSARPLLAERVSGRRA